MKPLSEQAGVYVIRCTANCRSYCGSSVRVERRLQLHVALLRSGLSPALHLQKDWKVHGEDAFKFQWCNKPVNELLEWEERITFLTGSLVDHGGYNRMVANGSWSPSSRIRNTETKLLKKGKFSYLPGIDRSQRLNPQYVRSFCEVSTSFATSEPELMMTVDPSTVDADLMAAFEGHVRFQPRRSLRHGRLAIEQQ